jgi:ABC-type glycerol-3-phosphate transport system permease component
MGRSLLIAAGWMSIAASLLHVACIVGGPSWYRFFGAGEELARAAERGSPVPAIITACIATVLGVWAAYAFSGAGMIGRLPLLRTALVAISAVLLVRGLGVPLMQMWRPDLSSTFLYVSSAIVLVYGLAFAAGTWTIWTELSFKGVAK